MAAHHVPHAPHTPPLWKEVISLPQTSRGWWAVGPSVISLVLLAWEVSVAGPWLGGEVLPIISYLTVTILAVWAVGGILALGALVDEHERSWLVWGALVPLLVVLSLLISPLTSLLNAGAVVTYSLAFLIVVLIVPVIAFWISRVNSEESR